MHALNKGKSGEREAAKWLHKWLDLDSLPERNLDQTRSGGYDLVGVSPFAVEVKRCETLNRIAWWKQVCRATPDGFIPLVMFRQNRKQWRFLISAQTIGVEQGFIEIEIEVFLRWAKPRLI